MTGKELLARLNAMTPEQLDWEVIMKTPDMGGDDYTYTPADAVATEPVIARDVPLLAMEKKVNRNDLIPAIVIS